MAPVRMAAQDLDPSPGDRLNPAAAAAMVKVAAAKPTPRGADGHPNLKGYWNFPEYGKAARLGSNLTIYIDVPPANGCTLIKPDATLEGPYDRICGAAHLSLNGRIYRFWLKQPDKQKSASTIVPLLASMSPAARN